jgi:5'-methylthioadenosine phosphorylase
MTAAGAEIGVIGGSGFYRFLSDVTEQVVATPYGAPSAPITVGIVGGRRVAFLPRHGVRHEYPPHRLN